MKQKKLLMIFNPRAGRNKPLGPLFEAVSVLSDAGYLVSVHSTSGPGDASDYTAAVCRSFDVVVAVGGDGTLNEVIAGLLRCEGHPPLGYIPQGSTNDFAASLQIPSNPVAAARLIANGKLRTLDAGFWNGRSFVYVASFGAFTRSSYSAPQAAKNALGHFAYLLEGMRDLDSLRSYRVNITADGETLDGEYLFGAVCNSTSLGGLMKLNPEKVALDDGKFEMLLVPNPTTALELQNLVIALLSQQYEENGLIFRHVSSVQIDPQEDLSWSLDGEYAPGEERIEIENRHGILEILL